MWTPLQIANYSTFGKTDLTNFINLQIQSNLKGSNSSDLDAISNNIVNFYINDTQSTNNQYYYLQQYVTVIYLS